MYQQSVMDLPLLCSTPLTPLTSVHNTDILLGFTRPAGRCPVHDIILDNLRFATGRKEKKKGQL